MDNDSGVLHWGMMVLVVVVMKTMMVMINSGEGQN